VNRRRQVTSRPIIAIAANGSGATCRSYCRFATRFCRFALLAGRFFDSGLFDNIGFVGRRLSRPIPLAVGQRPGLPIVSLFVRRRHRQ
jgi:hypothetical protein